MVGSQIFRVRCPDCKDNKTFCKNKPFYIRISNTSRKHADDPHTDPDCSTVVHVTDVTTHGMAYNCRNVRCRWRLKSLCLGGAREQVAWFNILLSNGLRDGADLEKVKRALKVKKPYAPVRTLSPKSATLPLLPPPGPPPPLPSPLP